MYEVIRIGKAVQFSFYLIRETPDACDLELGTGALSLHEIRARSKRVGCITS